jgi:hypothetical protein
MHFEGEPVAISEISLDIRLARPATGANFWGALLNFRVAIADAMLRKYFFFLLPTFVIRTHAFIFLKFSKSSLIRFNGGEIIRIKQ